MNHHEKLNYVEFASTDLSSTKSFFESVFQWKFVDYGPEYSSFSQQGLDGGFYHSSVTEIASNGAPLLVFYSANIEATQAKVEAAGGRINKPLFSFPGGRRFHFIEPGGNEFAVWTEPLE